jgi:hypothetical protein
LSTAKAAAEGRSLPWRILLLASAAAVATPRLTPALSVEHAGAEVLVEEPGAPAARAPAGARSCVGELDKFRALELAGLLDERAAAASDAQETPSAAPASFVSSTSSAARMSSPSTGATGAFGRIVSTAVLISRAYRRG